MAFSGDHEQDIYSTFSHYPACSNVQTLKYEDSCSYVRDTPECQKMMFNFNYMQVLYCILQPRSDTSQMMCVILLLSLCLFTLAVLGIAADKIFCPALKVISITLGMNEHLAGVTLVAIGNGSPDLFTSMASVDNTQRYIFSDLLGATIYVNAFVGDISCAISPFRVQTTNLLYDVCFLTFGMLLIDQFITSDSCVTTSESIFDQKMDLDRLRSEAILEIVNKKSRDSVIGLNRVAEFDVENTTNEDLFIQSLRTLNPFDYNEWQSSQLMGKILIILKSPITFALTLLVPIINYELERHGWTKLLNALQLNILPVVILGILVHSKTLYGIPILLYPLFVTVPACLLVLMTTRTDVPPSYHFYFSIYSIMGAVFIIYMAAAETVQIFNVLGIVTYCSNAFLGSTLLAWGNAVGDLASNITLARTGYQRMGFAACFGGPFFNTMLSVGGTFLYRCLKSPEGYVAISQGNLGENGVIFLTVLMISILLWSSMTDYQIRFSTAILCIVIYLLYFTFNILAELKIIESYAPLIASGILD